MDENGEMVYDSSCGTDYFAPKSNCDPSNAINVLNCNSEDCSDMELCISACEAKAQELDQEGCCYTFQGQRKTCQYHEQSSSVDNNGALRYATLCHRMTEQTTTTPSNTTPNCTMMASINK